MSKSFADSAAQPGVFVLRSHETRSGGCAEPVSGGSQAQDFAEEREWVAAAQAGCPAAFAALVARYQRRIFRLAKRITRNHEDAEDAVQEALLKAYKSLGSFRGDSLFSTWLVRITLNEAHMTLRRRRHNMLTLEEALETDKDCAPGRTPALVDPRPSPAEYCAQSEWHEILSRTLQALSPAFQQVLLLRYVEGQSVKCTASVLGVSLATVKSRSLRARSRLRRATRRYLRRGFPNNARGREHSASGCTATAGRKVA